jgi:hypothetical protein
VKGPQILRTGCGQKMAWLEGLFKTPADILTRLEESKMFYFLNHSCGKSNIQAAPANLNQGLLYIHTHTCVSSYYASCQRNDTELLCSIDQLARNLLLHSLFWQSYMQST